MGMPFDVQVFKNLSNPFTNGGHNNYSCFDSITDSFGVYVVQEKENGKVLYVGEAHKQDLKTRITQNYTESDTGGTFRKNWCDDNNKDFNHFKNALNSWDIKIISIDTKLRQLIITIEMILITVLKPKYNRT
jgi:excinuclease UvrABC nuclease subunit